MKTVLCTLGTALLLAATPAPAFDFNKLDIGKIQKAVEIGGKAVKANRAINEPEEIEIGDGIAARLLGAAPLVDDRALQAYVNRVGMWLALQTGRPDLPWRFGVIATDDVNAFSAPGGTILITRGMYNRFRNEGELAGVLAHEIGHVLEKHQLRQIQKSLGNEWKTDLVNTVANEKGNTDARNIAKAFSAGTEIYARGLDKQDEFAADRLGVVIAARAGYNPYGLVGVLQTLGELNAGDSAVALMFATHPTPSARLDMLDDAMGERLDDYASGISSTKRFVRPPR